MADISRALARDENAVRVHLLSTGGFSPDESATGNLIFRIRS
jgi:hypothetical protein